MPDFRRKVQTPQILPEHWLYHWDHLQGQVEGPQQYPVAFMMKQTLRPFLDLTCIRSYRLPL